MEISKTSLPCHNMMDVIDSRDIIERIEELDDLVAEQLQLELDGGETDRDWPEWLEELQTLKTLAEEAKDYVPDWEYGATLIRYSYFTEYCREMLEDCGDIPSNLPWYIADHIDWEDVARELKVDYKEVEFNGVVYYVR